MRILSIQSSVVHGHVGNSAARPILQALGHDVLAIDTVTFSNHPGHGRFKGRVHPSDEIATLLDGLFELGVAQSSAGMISGYLGEATTAEPVARAAERLRAQGAAYLLDPVMGDAEPAGDGRLYVRPGVPEAIMARLLPLADLVTPNRFELELLSGRSARTLDEARAAAGLLLARGPRLVLVTSFDGAETPADAIDTLAISAEGAWRVRTERRDRRYNGAGDSLAALFLAAWLAQPSAPAALGRAVGQLQPILAWPEQSGLDLPLIAALPLALKAPPASVEQLG